MNLKDYLAKLPIDKIVKTEILDNKINLENDLLTKYENQKKYLLQNLFV